MMIGHDLMVHYLTKEVSSHEVNELPGLGSNQGFQLQRLTCCHYTTGQFAGLRETPHISILLPEA